MKVQTLVEWGFISCLLLSSCSSEPTTQVAEVTWENAIDADLHKVSEFQREILSDYKITELEYHSAQDKYIECMLDQGFEVSTLPDGTRIHPAYEDEKEFTKIESDCNLKYLFLVELYYHEQFTFHENKIRNAQTEACLQERGVLSNAGSLDVFLRQPRSDEELAVYTECFERYDDQTSE